MSTPKGAHTGPIAANQEIWVCAISRRSESSRLEYHIPPISFHTTNSHPAKGGDKDWTWEQTVISKSSNQWSKARPSQPGHKCNHIFLTKEDCVAYYAQLIDGLKDGIDLEIAHLNSMKDRFESFKEVDKPKKSKSNITI